MTTFKESVNAIINTLLENAGILEVPSENIQILQSIPSTAPAVYVFASPTKSNFELNRGLANCVLFCCASNNIASEALFSSNSIAEKCAFLISNIKLPVSNVSIEFDTWYSSLAVSTVEFTFKYKKEVF